jgi:hypothetical protein
MLDSIGDIGGGAVNSGLLQRLIEQSSGRTNKRMSGKVLLVAGLFPYEHDCNPDPPFPEYGLRSCLPQIASFALERRCT